MCYRKMSAGLAVLVVLALGPLDPSHHVRAGEEPTGNVTAQLVDPWWPDNPNPTMLWIEGDNQPNGIRVIEDAPGHVRIEGLGATTVNGKAADDLFTSEVAFAEIHLGNGGDTLIYELTGAPFWRTTKIDSGLGDDSVSVFAGDWVGFLIIDTGAGNDNVAIEVPPTAVVNALWINTGLGDDTVLLRFQVDSDGGRPVFWGSLGSFIETEEGNDVVQFKGTFGVAGYALLVLLGGGDDTLIGDPESPLAPRAEGIGGNGNDTVWNAAYFGWGVYGFEIMN